MSTSTVGIWSNSQIVNATSNLTYKQTGVDTPSVKYTNASIYPLEIANTNYGVPIDVLPPMCAVISSNPINFTLTLDVSVGSNIPAEALTQSVSVTYIDAKVPYQIIPLSNLNVGSVTNISGNVDVSGSEIAVTSMPVTTVDFNGAQDVNLAASDITLDTQVSNVKLATNSLVPFCLSATTTVDNLANGDSIALNTGPYIPAGYYVGIFAAFHSSGGYVYSQATLALNYVNTTTNSFVTTAGQSTVNTGGSTTSGLQTGFSDFGVPTIGNGVYVGLINNTGATIASDTITLDVYFVQASVSIDNPSTNPVNAVAPPNDMQDASGSIAAGGTAQTVLDSNASRRFLSIVNPGNANGDTLWVNFGSDASAGAGSYPLGPGIGLFFPQGQFVPSSSVSLYAATTGDTFTVKYA